MKKFFSKILLFGEYSILTASAALTIPYRKYFANLELPATGSNSLEQRQSNNILIQFTNYLSTNKIILEAGFDIAAIKSDLKSKLFLQSNIPQNYGLGSSGALVAALFDKYLADIDTSPQLEIKTLMAEAESFFHGKSSGIDPLSIFNNNPILFKTESVQRIDFKILDPFLKHCYLLDTGQAAKTGKFVTAFLNKLEEHSINNSFLNYIKIVNQLIGIVVNGGVKGIELLFQEISDFQFHYFSAMVPQSIKPLWKKGLDQKMYYFKLCGSGGGGNILIYSKLKKIELEKNLGAGISPLI